MRSKNLLSGDEALDIFASLAVDEGKRRLKSPTSSVRRKVLSQAAATVGVKEFEFMHREEGKKHFYSFELNGRRREVSGTRLLNLNMHLPHRIVVHEGSSSSSKTFSLAQAVMLQSFTEEDKTYSVVRKTMPAMRRGALKDFKEVLTITEMWDYFKENKGENFFINLVTGTKIEFFALDDPQKARGPRRDLLWLNEANELFLEDFRQLEMRTKHKIFIDYNPSMVNSWIYDEVLTKPAEEMKHIHSTYKDNPFLTEANIKSIESRAPVYMLNDGVTTFKDWDLRIEDMGDKFKGAQLIAGDPFFWSVYGLGRRGSPGEAIYPKIFDSEGWPDGEDVYGLDFGWNHPTVLVRLAMRDCEPEPEIHIDEVVYSSFLKVQELVELMRDGGVPYDATIYADSAAPMMIKEIQDAGWYGCVPAKKGPGSVEAGITFMRGHRLCFTENSRQSKRQFYDYRWKLLPNGKPDDKPRKMSDDAPDAVRYGAHGHWGADLKSFDSPSGVVSW